MLILRTLDFNPTNNFIRIVNFNYSFVDVNVDVRYCISHHFFSITLTLNFPGNF